MNPLRLALAAAAAALLASTARAEPDPCPRNSTAPAPTECKGRIAGITFKLPDGKGAQSAAVVSFRPEGQTYDVAMQFGTPDGMALDPYARAITLMAQSIRSHPVRPEPTLRVTRKPDDTSAIITAVELARAPCWTYFQPGQPGTGATGCLTRVRETGGRIRFTVKNDKTKEREFTIPANLPQPLQKAALALLRSALAAESRFVAYCPAPAQPDPGGCPAGDIREIMIDNSR